MPTTINAIPAEIMQYFSAKLLSSPCLGDNINTLKGIKLYIDDKLLPKARYNSRRLVKCLELSKQIEEMIDEAEKKISERKTKNYVQGPLYYIFGLNKSDDNIFKRLRRKRYVVH